MFSKKRQSIMLVDDNQANLTMGKNMLKDFYEVYALPSAERLFKFLETVKPDLILLDVAMPNMDGFDVIKILKADARYADIPVIFVTSRAEEMAELEGLALGAADYVAKPFSASILLKRVENHLLIRKQKLELSNLNDNLISMVTQKASQIVGLQSSIINSIAELVEFRDALAGGHISRTQKYVRLLIDGLRAGDIYAEGAFMYENVDYIVSSSQLHDLGKLFISDAILNKPGELTPQEFEMMKTHVTKGVAAIRQMKKLERDQSFLDCAEVIAATHHEKWDGSGYPAGLSGLDIPLLGRLMAIADVYDGLSSVRSYHAAHSAREAEAVILAGAGSHFDPRLVEVFKEAAAAFAAAAAEP